MTPELAWGTAYPGPTTGPGSSVRAVGLGVAEQSWTSSRVATVPLVCGAIGTVGERSVSMPVPGVRCVVTLSGTSASLRTRIARSSTEVPVAGIKAVGSSFMLCILADVVMTAIQYLG